MAIVVVAAESVRADHWDIEPHWVVCQSRGVTLPSRTRCRYAGHHYLALITPSSDEQLLFTVENEHISIDASSVTSCAPMCNSSRVLNGPSRHGGNSLSSMPVAAMASVASPLAASWQIGIWRAADTLRQWASGLTRRTCAPGSSE